MRIPFHPTQTFSGASAKLALWPKLATAIGRVRPQCKPAQELVSGPFGLRVVLRRTGTNLLEKTPKHDLEVRPSVRVQQCSHPSLLATPLGDVNPFFVELLNPVISSINYQ